MANAELAAKVKLILANINTAEPVYALKKPLPTRTESAPPAVVTDPSDVRMAHKQVGLLKVLYGQCAAEDRSAFVQLLIEELSEKSALVLVVTLLHVGQLQELVKAIAGKRPVGNVSLRESTWTALAIALVVEPHRFAEDDLAKLDRVKDLDATWVRVNINAATLSRARSVRDLPPA